MKNSGLTINIEKKAQSNQFMPLHSINTTSWSTNKPCVPHLVSSSHASFSFPHSVLKTDSRACPIAETTVQSTLTTVSTHPSPCGLHNALPTGAPVSIEYTGPSSSDRDQSQICQIGITQLWNRKMNLLSVVIGFTTTHAIECTL